MKFAYALILFSTAYAVLTTTGSVTDGASTTPIAAGSTTYAATDTGAGRNARPLPSRIDLITHSGQARLTAGLSFRS